MIQDLLDTPYGKVQLELEGDDVYIHSDLTPLTPATYSKMLDDLTFIRAALNDVGYEELRAVIRKDEKKMNRFMPLLGFDKVGENDETYLYSIDTEGGIDG